MVTRLNILFKVTDTQLISILYIVFFKVSYLFCYIKIPHTLHLYIIRLQDTTFYRDYDTKILKRRVEEKESTPLGFVCCLPVCQTGEQTQDLTHAKQASTTELLVPPHYPRTNSHTHTYTQVTFRKLYFPELPLLHLWSTPFILLKRYLEKDENLGRG